MIVIRILFANVRDIYNTVGSPKLGATLLESCLQHVPCKH